MLQYYYNHVYIVISIILYFTSYTMRLYNIHIRIVFFFLSMHTRVADSFYFSRGPPRHTQLLHCNLHNHECTTYNVDSPNVRTHYMGMTKCIHLHIWCMMCIRAVYTRIVHALYTACLLEFLIDLNFPYSIRLWRT